MTIAAFVGEYRWLSNFWLAQVEYEDLFYPTVEHAYQAAKSDDPSVRFAIASLPTPGQAKRAGKGIKIRRDWDRVKLGVMEGLLRQKFQIPELREQLLATGDQPIVEGNTWNDTFWGVCRGEGKNHLGRLIEQIRSELQGASA